MRNIGNGDEQTKTLGILLGINRVIEVTRILAIDGDQWQCAQVEAPGGVRCLHLRIDLRRLAGDGLGPLVRQVVAGNGHLHGKRRRQAFPEHGQDAPDGSAMLGRRIGDFDNHDLAGACILRLAGADQDILVNTPVIRRNQGEAILDDHASNQARGTPLQHLDDRTLTTSTTINTDHAAQHAITVQHRPHLRGRKVQVLAAFIRSKESVAVGIGQDDAGNQVEFFGDPETATPVLQQLAIAHHRGKALAQGVDVVLAAQFESLGNRLGFQERCTFREQGQDGFTTWNGTFVALGFALRKRILARGGPGPCRRGYGQSAGRLGQGGMRLGHPGRQCGFRGFSRARLLSARLRGRCRPARARRAHSGFRRTPLAPRRSRIGGVA